MNVSGFSSAASTSLSPDPFSRSCKDSTAEDLGHYPRVLDHGRGLVLDQQQRVEKIRITILVIRTQALWSAHFRQQHRDEE